MMKLTLQEPDSMSLIVNLLMANYALGKTVLTTFAKLAEEQGIDLNHTYQQAFEEMKEMIRDRYGDPGSEAQSLFSQLFPEK